MFAWNYDDDFVGGYDHGKQAGTLCVADHHIVPGKKFWTWGNGPGGKLWDKTLTDDDGPYLELMVGAYSDNQPDYSWMEPYEAKIFDEFWFPIRDIGGVKKATKEAAMNLELKNGFAELGFNTTSSIANAMAMLKVKDKILLEEKISISPDKPYKKTIKLPAGTKAEDLHGALLLNNKEIIGYTPLTLKKEPFPEKVKPPLAPKEIKTNEELYLTGLRIQQFHNPSLSPEPYWQEALQRDSGDVKVNTAMGMLLLKKALYPEAEKYLRKAVERLTAKYTSPKDGEPYYYLGLALQQQGKFDDAYNAFYKATWNNEWKSAGYYALAEIDCQKGDFSKALDHINSSLMNNLQNTEALGLKATILRHLELHSEFSQVLQYLVSIDPLDTRALAENMLNGNQSTNQLYNETFNSFPENGLEQAIEYGNAGLWNDGLSLLKKLLDISPDKDKVSPMLYYYLGYFSEKSGQPEKSSVYYQLASTMPVDYVFPFQYENIDVLKQAIKADPKDARAPFYLGNLLYDWQPKEAIKYWELSVAIDSSFSMVHRNLAVGYANCENNTEKAILSLEKAITLPDVHAIHFFELDQLYETAGVSPEKRLAVLEKNHDMVNQRDDALSREIALKIFVGKYEEAIGYMQNRHFNVWEGGARFSVNDYWTDAHVLLGNKYMSQKQYQQALAEFQLAIEFPANLQTAKNRWSGRDPEVNYHIGEAYQLLGDKKQAEKYWKESSADIPAMGNDDVLPTTDQSILLYYKALSLKKLGNNEKANKIFNELVKSGQNALKKTSDVNFFAKFGQQKSERSRTTMAHYIIGLGYVGLSQIENAKLELTEALKESPDHLGTITALQELK
jgi:tetratricopeptide (TPR) repeat protein